jgi:hypothetical protein
MAKKDKNNSVVTSTIQIKMDINSSSAAATKPSEPKVDEKGEKKEDEAEFTEAAKKPELTTFSYKMLEIGDLKYPPSSTTIKRAPTSENPYFTDTAKYPDNLLSKNKQEILNFFFNKREFENVMSNEGYSWMELEKSSEGELNDKRMENEQHNVMIMLNCLFEVDPLINQSVVSTYSQYVLNKAPNVWNVGIAESLNFFGIMEKVRILNPERGVKLKIGGANKIVAEAKWTNDIVRHPEYLFFLKTYNNELKNLKSSIPGINKELVSKRKELMEKLDSLKDGDKAVTKLLGMLNTKFDLFKPRNNNSSSNNKYSPHHKYYILNSLSVSEFNKNIAETNLRTAFNVFKSHKSLLTYSYALAASIDPDLVASSRDLNESKRLNTQKVIGLLEKIQANINDMDSVAENILNIGIAIESSSSSVGYQDHSAFFTKDILNKNPKDFSVTTLSVQITALKNMKDFVEKGITMNLTDKRADGSDKTAIERNVDSFAKLNSLVSKSSDEISKAIGEVYTARKSSNAYLYDIIEKTKNGSWPKTSNPEEEDKQDQQKNAFSRIYHKYIMNKPLDVDIYSIRNCLYTGVDTLLQSSGKAAVGTKEICVYLNLLDDQNMKKSKAAKCVNTDDRLTNMLKYLLHFNTDELMNTFRDYRMAGPYVEPENKDKEKDNKEKDKDKQKVGGRKTRKPRIRKRRISRRSQ